MTLKNENNDLKKLGNADINKKIYIKSSYWYKKLIYSIKRI